MPVHGLKAHERDISESLATWEESMESFNTPSSHYWQGRGGPGAFSRYLESAIKEPDVLVVVADEKGTGLVGFSWVLIQSRPEWFDPERIGVLRYQAVSEIALHEHWL